METVELYLSNAKQWLVLYEAFGKESSKYMYIVWLAKASAIAFEYHRYEKSNEIEEMLMKAIYS